MDRRMKPSLEKWVEPEDRQSITPPLRSPDGLASPSDRCYRPPMDRDAFWKLFLLALAALVTWIFFSMIRNYAITLILAAIFAGWAAPLNDRITRKVGGRSGIGALLTLALIFFLGMIPTIAFLGVVGAQAFKVSQSVAPFLSEELARPDRLEHLLMKLPFVNEVASYQGQIYSRLGEAVDHIGTFLFEALSSTTRGTVTFFFHVFVFLYSMFWFLIDGEKLLRRILYYIPLGHAQEMRLTGRFVSVTRATLKGSRVGGAIPGGLAGLGFWVAGIPNGLFWATVMAVLSIIPAVGTPLIWIPAVVILFAQGHTVAAILLTLWCALVVGTIDNFLRPRLVGHDTAMHELLILLSTLGGLSLFGVTGFILGPVMAALFVTIWEIYGEAYSDLLPSVGPTRGISEDPP
jgi:predicted PurR-regulated permease PerM